MTKEQLSRLRRISRLVKQNRSKDDEIAKLTCEKNCAYGEITIQRYALTLEKHTCQSLAEKLEETRGSLTTILIKNGRLPEDLIIRTRFYYLSIF